MYFEIAYPFLQYGVTSWGNSTAKLKLIHSNLKEKFYQIALMIIFNLLCKLAIIPLDLLWVIFTLQLVSINGTHNFQFDILVLDYEINYLCIL